MKFGEKLQSLRKEKGLSQEALAQKCDVSRQAVSKWETSEGYPEMEKIILVSELFNVSLDYLLKDSPEEKSENNNVKSFMNSQRIQEYMEWKKKFGFRIACGVTALIFSLNIPLYFDGTKYDSFGGIGFLVVVACVVALFIMTTFFGDRYFELEKKEIYMSYNDMQDLQNEYLKFKSRFGISIAIGVFLIIISLAFTVYLHEYLKLSKGPMVFLFAVGVALFIFIVQGTRDSMYKFLTQNKQYIDEQRHDEESMFSITMPLAAMIYLVMGFVGNYWHPGWLVFPITVFLTMGLDRFLKERKR